MTSSVFQLLGGVGLFLLGMVLMTDGLKAFAGDALRGALVRFTGTPLKAFASGALATVMVQSSSATTVTVIGFVSAGLLTFPQAVGMVFGASLGTTGTGWIVSVLGLKISVGTYALPLVGVGAFFRLLGRGRTKSLGLALAGFGLIFIGIETLQGAMQGLSSVFNLAALPSAGLLAHLLALLVGIVLTLVLQSSSAAVATTLTALHTGSVNFEQAASIVIGAAIGTTITGALAAIGGSVPAKRTAAAHILFNLATGLIALLLLPVFLRGLALAQTHFGLEPGATSLAAFHTAFIALGVVLFMPFVRPFSRFIERLLPDRGPTLTRHLDDSLLHAPSVALEATRRALTETARAHIDGIARALDGTPPAADAAQPAAALDAIRAFFARIPPVGEGEPPSALRVSQLHAIDHLTRLGSRLEPPESVRKALTDPRLAASRDIARRLLATAATGLASNTPADWLDSVTRDAAELADIRRDGRPALLQRTADGGVDPADALAVLDAMRWLDRIGYHAWRASHHLASDPAAPLSVATPADITA